MRPPRAPLLPGSLNDLPCVVGDALLLRLVQDLRERRPVVRILILVRRTATRQEHTGSDGHGNEYVAT